MKKGLALSDRRESNGYTIIELLAVISILIIISGIISGILYSTLRGSSKARITTEVTQNGNYALSLISNIIVDSTNVTHIDGVPILDCTTTPPGSGKSITLARLDGGTTTLACESNTISSNSASLINTNKVQVEEDSCFFYCTQTTNDPYAIPILEVTFNVRDKDTGLFESQASSTFNTSVSIRNYAP